MNAADASVWCAQRGLIFNRKTFYAHKRHYMSGPDKLVQYADNLKATQVQIHTNEDVADAIIRIGMANVEADPSQVNVNHVLKAQSLKERRKEQQIDFFAIAAKLMLGGKIEQMVTITNPTMENDVPLSH